MSCLFLFYVLLLCLWFLIILFPRNIKKSKEPFEEKKEDENKTVYLQNEFADFSYGYFTVGGFLLQWGFTGSGPGGKIVNSNKQNPTFSIIAGITLDMIEHRLGWETSVSLSRPFEEIYGAHAMTIGDKGTIYENIRVAQLNKQNIIFRTSSEHSPFFWFAYGLKSFSSQDEE